MTDEFLSPSPATKVSLADLPRWITTLLDGSATPLSEPPTPRSKFPFDESIANKLILWQGNLVDLDVDAIVNSTNESLTDRNGLCGTIFERAGPGLELEVQKLEGCRTGEAKITKGFNLSARFVIHTVGPRFNQKYKTAAENALHNCYRNSLQVLKENGLTTIGFPVVNSEKRGYPREDGAHIAARTIRRFLERYGSDIEAVVLAVDKPEDHKIYHTVLPLYFPRSLGEEAASIPKLPADTGNEIGETVFEERKIRIKAFPGAPDSDDEEEDPYEQIRQIDTPAAVEKPKEKAAPAVLTTLQGDPDAAVKATLHRQQDAESMEEELLYHRYLKRAKTEDLSDIARMNIIYNSGKDSSGRPIVVVIGSNLPSKATEQQLERVLLYIIRIMDPIVEKEYLLVYLHTNMRDDQQPEFSWLRNVYNIWDRKYSHNLNGLYIVSPTFWLKLFITVMRPFVSDVFLDKMRYFDEVSDILRCIDPEQLKLPPQLLPRSANGGQGARQWSAPSAEIPGDDL